MLLKSLEFALGMLVVWLSLKDVFDTVVVPGEARGPLRIARRLVSAALPACRRMSRQGIGLSFGPSMLLACFVVWMLLLVLGFGLMTHAVRDAFSPAARSFGEALYLAGTALTTVGFGNSQPSGLASLLGVVGGFCGLAVMTMAVTYLLQVQSNVAARDAGVLKLSTSAGHPPSALALLERYAALGAAEELDALLRGARDWCAMVLQSHASHPSLIYFRSAGVASGWPVTLGALVDLALIVEHMLLAPRLHGLAVLAREEGEGLANTLAGLLALAPTPATTVEADLAGLRERLERAGYAVSPDFDGAAFAATRQRCLACIESLVTHLGMAGAPLAPARRHPLAPSVR